MISIGKTILVGPNEAGKTVLLKALQQLNPPNDIPKFNPLHDPRSEYNDITTKKVDPKLTIVEGHFVLEESDKKLLGKEFQSCIYVCGRRLDNTAWQRLEGGIQDSKYVDIKNDLILLCSHMDTREPKPEEGKPATPKPSETLATITKEWIEGTEIMGDHAKSL